MKIKVQNMCSSSGREVPNQFIINTEEGTYFQSYNSIITFKPIYGPIQLGSDWDYSRTTSKYRNMFLRESKQETLRKLRNGTYTINPSL